MPKRMSSCTGTGITNVQATPIPSCRTSTTTNSGCPSGLFFEHRGNDGFEEGHQGVLRADRHEAPCGRHVLPGRPVVGGGQGPKSGDRVFSGPHATIQVCKLILMNAHAILRLAVCAVELVCRGLGVKGGSLGDWTWCCPWCGGVHAVSTWECLVPAWWWGSSE